jgi:Tat protein translocase TatB subunit
LIFIGVIALIIFGPRKLPQLARTVGKAMADFRRTTNEFKETWEKEVDFEEFKEEGRIKQIAPAEKTIAKNGGSAIQSQLEAPEVKEIRGVDFESFLPKETNRIETEKQTEKTLTEKQNWL